MKGGGAWVNSPGIEAEKIIGESSLSALFLRGATQGGRKN